MDLTTVLDARDATVCVVVTGSKKSTLFALADRELPPRSWEVPTHS